MKIYSFILIFVFSIFKAIAQDGFQTFLMQINTNNKKIQSAEKLMVAEELEAYSGIYLTNPSVEYEQVGSELETSSELTVAQSFDFPTAYAHRKSIAAFSKDQSSIAFRQVKREVMANAARVYVDQIYLNRKKEFYMDLKNLLDTLLINVDKTIKLGEIDILKANRIRSEAIRNKVNLSELETDFKNNAYVLRLINGDQDLEIATSDYPLIVLPSDPDSLEHALLINHPEKEYWKAELEKSGKEIKLMRATSLPGFEVGYKQESNSSIGSVEYGFMAGITIPLFENKNTVKHAIAKKSFLENEFNTAQLELENEVAVLVNNYYSSLQSLQYADELEQSLSSVLLLWKAYNSGQIGYTEFFEAYGNYCEMFDYIEKVRKQVYSDILQLYVLLHY